MYNIIKDINNPEHKIAPQKYQMFLEKQISKFK